MAFNYSGLETTADRLISQFGRPMRYRRLNRSEPDSDRPWELNTSAPYDDQADVYAVFLGFTDRESEDTVVEENDFRVLVAAKNLTVTPTAGDLILDDSDVYTAINVTTIQPGATAVAYDMQMRK